MLVAALVICPTVIADIVPGISIAGVRLGDGPAKVRAKLGPPPQIRHVPAAPAGTFEWGYTRKQLGDVGIAFDHNRVIRIFIAGLPRKGAPVVSERTKEGIGIGSPMSAVDRAYPGHCFFQNPKLHHPPVCTWFNSTSLMAILASGRFGYGRNTPAETIKLEYR